MKLKPAFPPHLRITGQAALQGVLVCMLLAGAGALRAAPPTSDVRAYLPLVQRTGAAPARAVVVADGYLYLGMLREVRVFDLRDPAAPSLRAILPLGRAVTDMQVDDGILYLTTADPDHGTLQIVDVSDPTHPTLRGVYAPMMEPLRLAVAEGIAYIVDWTQGLLIVDVRDPAHPFWRGSYTIPGEARDVQVQGQVAYVAYGDLLVLDVSRPGDARQLVRYVCKPPVAQVRVRDGLAYLAGYDGVSQILDVRDLLQATRLGSFASVYYPQMLEMGDGLIFVAGATSGDGGCSGLQVFDTRDPAHVRLSATVGPPQVICPRDAQPAGAILYVADGQAGLRVLDLTDPSAPVLRYPLAGATEGAAKQISHENADVDDARRPGR